MDCSKWRDVEIHLQNKDLNQEQRAHIIDTAIDEIDEPNFFQWVLPYYSFDQSRRLTDLLIGRRQWKQLSFCLQGAELKAEQRHHILTEVIRYCDEVNLAWWFKSFCGNDPSGVLQQRLDKTHCWSKFGDALRGRDANAEERSRLIRFILSHCEEQNLIDCIIPHCSLDETILVIAHCIERQYFGALARCLWRKDLSRDIYNSSLQAAIFLADKESFKTWILSLCSGDQTVHRTARFVKRGSWQELGDWLRRPDLTPQQRLNVLDRSITKGDEGLFLKHIFPACSPEEKSHVKAWFIQNNLWWSLCQLLEQNALSPLECKTMVDKAIGLCNKECFTTWMLPQCDSDQRKSVVEWFLKDHYWRGLGRCLQWKDMSFQQRKGILDNSIGLCDKECFMELMISHCGSGQRKSVVEWFLRDHYWKGLGRCLQWKDLSFQQRKGILDKSIGLCDKECFMELMISHCGSGQRKSVVEWFLRDHYWKGLGRCLQWKDLSFQQRKGILDKSIGLCDKECFMQLMISHCGSGQRKSGVEWFLRDHYWKGLVSCLQWKDLRFRRRRGYLDTSIGLCDKEWFMKWMSPLFRSDQRKSVVDWFLRDHYWEGLSHCIKWKDLSVQLCRHILDKSIGNAEKQLFAEKMLPYCDGDYVTRAAGWFIREDYWPGVARCLLRRDLRTEHRMLMLEETMKHADETTCIKWILPQCSFSDLRELAIPFANRRWFGGLCRLIEHVRYQPMLVPPRLSTYKHRLLESLRLCPGPLTDDEPMAFAIFLNQPDFVSLMYELGLPSLSAIPTLIPRFQRKTLLRDKDKHLSFLESVSSNPRSLMSVCRIVILGSFRGSGLHHSHVEQLPLPLSVKNYLLFSGFTCPSTAWSVC